MQNLSVNKTVSYDDLIEFSKKLIDYDSVLKENEKLKNNIELKQLNSLFKIIEFYSEREYDKRYYSHWYQGSYEGYIAHFRRCDVDRNYFEEISKIYCENQPPLFKSIISKLATDYRYYYDMKCELENYSVKLHLAKYKRDEQIRKLSSEIRFLEEKLNSFIKEYRPITRMEIIGRNEYISRNSPEYFKFKQDVLSRDDYTCQCCGSKENLEVHHKYAMNQHNSLGATVSNGIVLCEKCHKNYHHNYGWKNNCSPITLKKFIGEFWNKSPLNNYNQNPENMYLKERIRKLEGIISEKDAEIKRLSNIDYMKTKIEEYEFNQSKEREIEDLKIKKYDKIYENCNVFDLVKKGVF